MPCTEYRVPAGPGHGLTGSVRRLVRRQFQHRDPLDLITGQGACARANSGCAAVVRSMPRRSVLQRQTKVLDLPVSHDGSAAEAFGDQQHGPGTLSELFQVVPVTRDHCQCTKRRCLRD